MRALQTDYLDILLLHNPPREMMDGRVAPELMRSLKNSKPRARSANTASRSTGAKKSDMVVDTTKSKALEVFFNALYQEPLPAFQKA